MCDRGSSHIRFQDGILREEYDIQRLSFSGIDPRGVAREEEEYDLADSITVPSAFVYDSFVSMGISRAKLRLVPYGVDLTKFYPTARPNDKEFRVLFVGGVSVRKGFQYLIDAFDKLDSENKNLMVVGGIEPALRETVSRLRSRSNVTFTGHLPQPRLKDVMSSSHVLVLPSVEEGLALVQAQAMACGCPVVSSKNTGGADLFTDGVEGFITSIRNSDAIAHRLQKLADDPHLQEKMSAAALQRVQSVGGWDEYGEAMYRTFEELAGR